MANHRFVQGGTGCCAICDDLPGQGEHAPLRIGMKFKHNRMIIGSPKAGTARPDVCTVTKVTKSNIYYRNESGMLLTISRGSGIPGEVIEP